MTVAEVGNIVEFMDGLRGRVEKINNNRVIVDLLALVHVACVYLDQLGEIDKHLSKLRKKDYAAKWLFGGVIFLP